MSEAARDLNGETQPDTTLPARKHTGQFKKGNPGGPGNPFYKRIQELRRALYDQTTGQDVVEVMATLAALAKGGDVAAIKLYLAYTVGAPEALPSDQDESIDVVAKVISSLPQGELVDYVKSLKKVG